MFFSKGSKAAAVNRAGTVPTASVAATDLRNCRRELFMCGHDMSTYFQDIDIFAPHVDAVDVATPNEPPAS